MKRKQFEKGMTEIAQEGAIQIFHAPGSGLEEVIVGVVGILQLEVLEYRLKTEYGVDVRRRGLPYQFVRWIENTDMDLSRLNLGTDSRWVQDFKGNNLLVFGGQWSIRWAEEKNPGLILREFKQD